MPGYDDDLLDVSLSLLGRRSGQKGPLANGFIRRSISTSYYALFHFLLEQASTSVMGATGPAFRRRALSRSFSHAGMRTAMNKVRGKTVDPSIEGVFRRSRNDAVPIATPSFVQGMAQVSLDVQSKREDADYDLNERLGEADARLIRKRVQGVILAWQDADAVADREFKHSLCVLLLTRGQIRPN